MHGLPTIEENGRELQRRTIEYILRVMILGVKTCLSAVKIMKKYIHIIYHIGKFYTIFSHI